METVTCEYCGGERIFEAGKKCEGCGAPLKMKQTAPRLKPPQPFSQSDDWYMRMMQNQFNSKLAYQQRELPLIYPTSPKGGFIGK
jgi:methionyl-tRNA synthetase